VTSTSIPRPISVTRRIFRFPLIAVTTSLATRVFGVILAHRSAALELMSLLLYLLMMSQFLQCRSSGSFDLAAPRTGVRGPVAGRFEAGVFVGGFDGERFEDMVGCRPNRSAPRFERHVRPPSDRRASAAL
jgi:hypothetical protein